MIQEIKVTTSMGSGAAVDALLRVDGPDELASGMIELATQINHRTTRKERQNLSVNAEVRNTSGDDVSFENLESVQEVRNVGSLASSLVRTTKDSPNVPYNEYWVDAYKNEIRIDHMGERHVRNALNLILGIKQDEVWKKDGMSIDTARKLLKVMSATR